MKKLTAIVIGYGLRGESYSRYSVEYPEKLEIVGVADPDEKKKKRAPAGTRTQNLPVMSRGH